MVICVTTINFHDLRNRRIQQYSLPLTHSSPVGLRHEPADRVRPLLGGHNLKDTAVCLVHRILADFGEIMDGTVNIVIDDALDR